MSVHYQAQQVGVSSWIVDTRFDNWHRRLAQTEMEVSDDVLKYVSAEDSLSSASLEDGESSMGSSVTADENFEPIVGSIEPENLEILEKEIITDTGASASERKVSATAGKRNEAIIADESILAKGATTRDTQASTSSAPSTSLLSERPQVLRLHDGRYSTQSSSDSMSSSSSTHEMCTPPDLIDLASEEDIQPVTRMNSLIEASNNNAALNCSREESISDAFSGITYKDSGSIPTDVSDISGLPVIDREASVLTSQFESDEENDFDAYRRGSTVPWGVDERELEDKLTSLRLEGDLDDLPEQRPDVYKVPEERNRSEDSLWLWPAYLLSQTIDFQMRIIMFWVSIVMWFFNLFVVEPINLMVLGKDTAVAGVSNTFSAIFNTIEFLEHLPAQVGPVLKKVAKKLGIGVLTATYVSVVLIFLLIPAFLLGILLVGRYVEEPIEIQERLYFDYTLPSPSAAVSLFPAHVMPRVKALAAMHPEKIVNKRLIPLNHKFHVIVNLKMPESEHNRQIGMFQVSAELFSLKGQLIARFTRPCMLEFHSWPIRYAKTVIMAMPLLLGLYSESQVVVLHLIDSYEDKPNPTASVNILLESRVGYPPGAGLPEVYSADVIIQSKLPWVKSIVYQWKWTFYVWSGLGFFFFEVALVLCCCRQVLIPQVSARESNRAESRGGEENQRDLAAIQEDLAGGSQSQGRRRVLFQEDIPIANVIPEVEFNTNGIDKFVKRELESLTDTKANLDDL